VYTEEKFEDEEDMRERVRHTVAQVDMGTASESDDAVQGLIHLAKQHELDPMMVDILKHYTLILQRDIEV
jgi:chromatin segregation and condensation protein Rec8/ScpA/Scc1 (kleisin family)